MKILQGLGSLGFIIGAVAFSNVIVPINFMDIPTNFFKSIKVRKVVNTIQEFEDDGKIISMPQKEIFFDSSNGKFSIVLYKQPYGSEEYTEYGYSHSIDRSNRIYGSPYWNGNSGEIGLVIFGLPGTILLSPLILLTKLLFLPLEKSVGMDRHKAIFWLKIKDELKEMDSEAYELLKKYLKYN
jgi:hypothetical protein